MPSKKGKAFSGNIGLKIDGKLSFDKLKVTEKFNSFYTFVLQLLQNLWRSYHRVLTNIVSEYDQEIPQVWKEG